MGNCNWVCNLGVISRLPVPLDGWKYHKYLPFCYLLEGWAIAEFVFFFLIKYLYHFVVLFRRLCGNVKWNSYMCYDRRFANDVERQDLKGYVNNFRQFVKSPCDRSLLTVTLRMEILLSFLNFHIVCTFEISSRG